MRPVNSERLLDLILDRQIRGKELARQAGLSTGAISNLLRRGARAQLVTISKLAKALNVSPRELIEETSNVEVPKAENEQRCSICRKD